MSRLIKSKLHLFLLVFFVSILATVLSPAIQQAFAWRDSTFSGKITDLPPSKQITATVSANILLTCLSKNTAEFSQYNISEAQITAYDWFNNLTDAWFTVGPSALTYVGMPQESVKEDDGTYYIDCYTSKAWLGNILNTLGYNDPVLAYCNMFGAIQENKFDSAFISRTGGGPCVGGSGELNVHIKSSGISVETFRENLNQYFSDWLGVSINHIKDTTNMPSDAASYLYYLDMLTQPTYCDAQPISVTGGGNQVYEISNYIDPASPTNQTIQYFRTTTKNNGTKVASGNALLRNNDRDNWITCGEVAKRVNNYAAAYYLFASNAANQDKVAADISGYNAGSGSGGNTDLCDSLGTSTVRWIMCPLFTILDGFTNWVRGIVQSLLTINTSTFFSQEMHGAWATFRNFALTLLVIAALIMVISQILGFNFLDAYTVKKVLPRLLIAIIGITLSWELLRFFVQFFNDIGGWIYDIITGAFQSSLDSNSLPLGGSVGSVAAGAAGGAIVGGVAAGAIGGIVLLVMAPGGMGAILAVLGLFALQLLIGLAVLGIRAAVIGTCIIIAPLAIAAYILPGTKKMWDFWQNTIFTALLMFPIVMAFLAAGAALSSVIGVTDTGWTSVLGLLVYFAPYMLLPFSFKLAGGLMKTIFSITDDKSKGAFDRLRKRRSAGFGKTKEHYGKEITQKRADVLGRLQQTASRNDGKYRKRARFGAWVVGGGKYGNVEARMSAIRAEEAKKIGDQIATGVDDEPRGLTVSKATADATDAAVAAAAGTGDWEGQLSRVRNGVKEYKSLGGGWVSEARVDAAHKRWEGNTFAQQAAVAYELSKASSEEDVEGLTTRYADLTQAWGMTDSQAAGVWKGATYQQQNKFRHLKSTDWRTGGFTKTDAATGATVTDMDKVRTFVNEVHENLGSYPLSQMNSSTLTALQFAYREAERTGDLETQTKIAGISETFMHDIGTASGQVGAAGDDGTIPLFTPDATGPRTTTGRGERQASTPGAAKVAERVRELAAMTGVDKSAPSKPYVAGVPDVPPQEIPRQK